MAGDYHLRGSLSPFHNYKPKGSPLLYFLNIGNLNNK